MLVGVRAVPPSRCRGWATYVLAAYLKNSVTRLVEPLSVMAWRAGACDVIMMDKVDRVVFLDAGWSRECLHIVPSGQGIGKITM